MGVGNTWSQIYALQNALYCLLAFYYIYLSKALLKYEDKIRRIVILVDLIFATLLISFFEVIKQYVPVELIVTIVILQISTIVYLSLPKIKQNFSKECHTGIFPNLETLGRYWKISIILGVLFVWHLWGMGQDQYKCFENYVIKPIPGSVKILNYWKVGWQDPSATITFSINESDLNLILADYKPAQNCYENMKMMFKQLPESEVDCFYRRGIPNCKYCNDDLFLLWDRKNNTAYFRSINY